MTEYSLHKKALHPLLHQGKAAPPTQTGSAKIPETFEPELIELIRQQGLAGHWYELLGKKHKKSASQHDAFDLFKDHVKQSTFLYLDQLKTIHQLHRLFGENNISYAVYKGTHLREVLYDPPPLRDAADIDVLISPLDRRKAVSLLVQEGFKPYLRQRNISVEASFSKGQSSIDLHWNILREQRTKVNVVESFLSAKNNEKDFYCLKPEDVLFVMFVHPVFVKYLTTPYARLSNIVDIYRWIERHEIDWKYLTDLLKRTHLQTAAWLTATYCELLTSIPLPGELNSKTRPGSLKAAYLTYWVNHNLSTRFVSLKAIPQLFFTLPAQDTFLDACGLLFSAFPEAKKSKKIMAELEQVIENSGGRS